MEPGQVFKRDEWHKALAAHGTVTDRRDGPGGTEILTFSDGVRVTVAYTPGKTLADARFTVQSVEQASGSNPEQDRVAQFFSEHGEVRSVKELPEREIGGGVLKRPVIRYEFQDGAVLELAPPAMDAQGNVREPQSIVTITLPKDKRQAESTSPPRERNANGRREKWNPETDQWEDIGPAISSSATAAGAMGGQILNLGNGRVVLIKPDGTKEVIEEGRETRTDEGRIVNLGDRGVYLVKPEGSTQQVLPGTPTPPKTTAPAYDETKKEWGQWVTDEQGNTTWRKLEGGPAPAGLPADAPLFTPNQLQDDLGLTDYSRQIWSLVQAGTLSTDQATKLVGIAKDSATTTLSTQLRRETSGITQRGQDITRQGNLLTFANQGLTSGLGMLEKTQVSPEAAGKIIPALMALQGGYGGLMGGMNPIPRVQIGGAAGTPQAAPTGLVAPTALGALAGGPTAGEALPPGMAAALPGLTWGGGQLRAPGVGPDAAIPALQMLDKPWINTAAESMRRIYGDDPIAQSALDQAIRETVMGM